MHKTFSLFILVFIVQNFACKSDKSADPRKVEPVVEASISTVSADTINYIMGLFEPSQDDRFTVIDIKHADREGLYMRKEAYASFINMYEAALEKGIKLVIRSAARNFDYQKGIWERKWTGETILSNGINAATDIEDHNQRALEILKYSSMPGTSRHHWGTDIDFNSFDNSWFESGQGLVLFNWLEENAGKFGFCRPYTQKGPVRPEGYNEEKWHWSYTPIADDYTKYAQAFLSDDMIKGFKGSETASSISVVQNYVLGIHPLCKNYN